MQKVFAVFRRLTVVDYLFVAVASALAALTIGQVLAGEDTSTRFDPKTQEERRLRGKAGAESCSEAFEEEMKAHLWKASATFGMSASATVLTVGVLGSSFIPGSYSESVYQGQKAAALTLKEILVGAGPHHDKFFSALERSLKRELTEEEKLKISTRLQEADRSGELCSGERAPIADVYGRMVTYGTLKDIALETLGER